jgi:hypothetical protein
MAAVKPVCPANVDERQQPRGDGHGAAAEDREAQARGDEAAKERLLVGDQQDQRGVEHAVDGEDGDRHAPMRSGAGLGGGGELCSSAFVAG